jgi:hypothetical protein
MSSTTDRLTRAAVAYAAARNALDHYAGALEDAAYKDLRRTCSAAFVELEEAAIAAAAEAA